MKNTSQHNVSTATSLLEEVAKVIDYKDGWARVEVELKSACSHCASSDNCGTSAISNAFSVKTQEFSILSEKPCLPGDMLKLGLPESVIIKAAALVYLLPLVGLFSFSFLGHFLSLGTDINPNTVSMVMAALGGFTGWRVGKYFAANIEAHAQPQIIAYLGQEISLSKIE